MSKGKVKVYIYRDYFYYGCQHRNMTRGHKCDYKIQINEEMEVSLVAAKAKRRSILSDKVSGDNIYKALVFFDKMYDKMNEAERREFTEQLIEKVEVYEERQPNGQWLRTIEFKLPIIEHDMKLGLDNGDSVECVTCLQRVNIKK